MTNTYFLRFHHIKYHLLYHHPFFGQLLLSLNFGLTDCQTCYTDMKNIIFDCQFIDQLNDLEFEVCIYHELLHCVFQHCVRSIDKQSELYNIACDIVVNSFIYQAYNIEKIADIPLIHQYQGQEGYLYTADEIYDDLLNKNIKQYKNIDRHDIWKILCHDHQLSSQMNIKIQSLLKKYPHSLNHQLRKVIDLSLNHHISWKELLYQYLTSYNNDYSFQKRDMRFFDQDYFIPDFIEEDKRLHKIMIAIDVSSSITDKHYTQFIQEVIYLKNLIHFEGYISFFNTKITDPIQLDHFQLSDFKHIQGYGGTSYDIIFEKINSFFQKEKLDCVIIFTDGYCQFPPPPPQQVIWILTRKINVPFGQSIIME